MENVREVIKRKIFHLAIKYIASCIRDGNKLTPDLLKLNGWIYENGFYIEPNIKERDKVWIQFEHHYYRVFHGRDRTFIALESSKQWLQAYLLLRDKWSKLSLTQSSNE